MKEVTNTFNEEVSQEELEKISNKYIEQFEMKNILEDGKGEEAEEQESQSKKILTKAVSYSNSPLVNYTYISPNRNSPRSYPITRITIHCVVGQCTVEALGSIFAPVSRQASSNYGIGYDGRVGMYCPESDRSWCSSSWDNDQRAITIETASNTYHPYAVTDAAYSKLIDLCVDICKRNGKTKLLWLGDANTTLNYVPKSNEMIMTAHRWFASTICPGDYLYSRFGDIAKKVTAKLSTRWVEKINGEWYCVVGGNIDYSYNGIAQNSQGWWKIKNGKVDFTFTGLAQNENGWFYLKGGKVDFSKNSIVQNSQGWWKVTNGKVDFSYNGLAKNENGWFMLQKGKVDFDYEGLCVNEYGTWLLNKGKVNFKYSGNYTFSGKVYRIKEGKVV